MPSFRFVLVVTVALALGCAHGEDPVDTFDGVGENHVGSCFPDDGEFALASGVITTSGTDLSFSAATVSVELLHKLDVDEVEGGCVAAATVVLDEVEGGFCQFQLDFEGSDAGDLALVAAALTVDSGCPGWDDTLQCPG